MELNPDDVAATQMVPRSDPDPLSSASPDEEAKEKTQLENAASLSLSAEQKLLDRQTLPTLRESLNGSQFEKLNNLVHMSTEVREFPDRFLINCVLFHRLIYDRSSFVLFSFLSA